MSWEIKSTTSNIGLVVFYLLGGKSLSVELGNSMNICPNLIGSCYFYNLEGNQ